nr:unnamed protein product [Digitaria exilis]
MVVVQGDEYYSDTDSDDDVDRYVFLARHPTPAAARHAEDDDRGASSENHDDDDGDGDATEEDEKEPERGRGVKRTKVNPLREISDDDDVPPPSPNKKARVVELTAPQFVRTQLMSNSGSETESDSAASPFGVRAEGESRSEGSHHEKAHHEHRRDPGNKKRGGVCMAMRRRRGPGCDEDGDRESHAAAAAAKIVAKSGALPTTVTSGRFLCPECERCFDNHQALGGHVLGHRKNEKIAIAAAAAATSLYLDDAGGGAANYKEETTTAVAEVNNEEKIANGIAQADMMGVVAARRGKGNGRHGKIKTVDFVAEHRDEDVDDDHANDGNPGFGNKGNAKVVSGGRDFTNGKSNDKAGAAIPSKKVVVVGTCHEGANGGDGNLICSTTLYKCKVCGAECTTGRALGGHMRKHRKRPPPGGEEGRSPSPPTDDDYQMTLARLFGAENKIGLV